MRLLIAESPGPVRTGIRLALEASHSFTVVGEADNGHEVVSLVGETCPDVVLLDADIPGLGALACLERLQLVYPHVDVFVLGTEASATSLQSALARGARGWFLKPIPPDRTGPAIAEALLANVLVPYFAVDEDRPSGHLPSLPNLISLFERVTAAREHGNHSSEGARPSDPDR